MAVLREDFTRARDYLGSPDTYLWKWEDAGRVVCWSDGATIAFAEEIQGIFSHLQDEGLPSFSAILLILSATRDNWPSDDSMRETIKQLVRPVLNAESDRQIFTGGWLEQSIAALDRIHALPDDLRKGLVARQVLIAEVLAGTAHARTAEDSACIARAFHLGLPEHMLVRESSKGVVFQQLMADLDAIRKGMENVSEEGLIRKRETGLSDEVVEAPLDLSLQEQILRLVESLDADDEFEGLARLTRQLTAAMHLPRPLSELQDLPLGGFSDISNKGPLDRLLLSELANDDLVLMVRIALNEALYLKRETPPNNQVSDCAVLVDSGIRTWGVPRLFGTAVALAAGATAGRQRDLTFYQSLRSGVIPSELTTREGLVAHLGVLDAAPHPGDSLRALLERPEGYSEVLLITQKQVMDDPEFRILLRGLPDLMLHVATVDRDGDFAFMEVGRHGTKVLRTAHLDLEDILFSQRRTPESLIDESARNDRLPAIFSLKEFPFLLPVKSKVEHALVLDGVLYCLMADGRMMRRKDASEGGRQVLDSLEKGAWFIETDYRSGWIHVVVFQRPERYRLISYHPELDELSEAQFRCDNFVDPVYAGVFDQYFYAVSDRFVAVWRIGSGELLGVVSKTDLSTRSHQRFFLVHGVWCQLVVHEDKPTFEPLTLPTPHDQVKIVFTTMDDERPRALREDWTLVDYDGEEVRLERPADARIRGKIKQVYGFAKNNRMIVVSDQTDESWRIGVATGRIELYRGSVGVVPEPGIMNKLGNERSLRVKFQRVGITPSGMLVLVSRKGHQWMLELNPDKTGLEVKRLRKPTHRSFKSLLKTPSPLQSRVRLQVAQFGEALRVFIDSRGLLHVKPMHGDGLEFSFVLCDPEVAGWCSDGSMIGTSYFLGDRTSMDAEVFYKKFVSVIRDACA